MTSGCVYCGRGFCEECEDCPKSEGLECHLKVEPVVISSAEPLEPQDPPVAKALPAPDVRKKTTRDTLKDPQSTGRKRAARLYPLDPEAPCDWQGKKECGGGRRPIIGCLDGKQQHRHHGPVKNTVKNHEGNVHRICTACHVHWHELNDLIYDEKDYGLLPHEPVEADETEIVQNILDWKLGKMGERFQLASSVKGNKLDLVD